MIAIGNCRWPALALVGRRDQVIYYQYRHDRVDLDA
jgi:hypothetical protein